MQVGKLDTETLKQMLGKSIRYHRPEVMVRPKIGEDCAVVDFGDYACVLSTDPITGASSEIGRLAVHIACNDVASNGVEPLGIMLTIMAPLGTTIEQIEAVMKEAGETAAGLQVEIIGGHTEITEAVNRMIISATAIGRQKKEAVVISQGAKVGDLILMTKTAGLEGTAILAHDREEQLREVLEGPLLEGAKKMLEAISVVPEGRIAGQIGVSSMHDVTEGGLLGAVWELCEASEVGAVLYEEEIPVAEETKKICEYFQIDPLRLISSGCMVMTVDKNKKDLLLKQLEEAKIKGTIIGEIIENGRFLVSKDRKIAIAPPESDELYKVV
ncbi:MAG: AIR synthase family protein [Thermotaleaceae bacterium]